MVRTMANMMKTMVNRKPTSSKDEGDSDEENNMATTSTGWGREP